MSTDSVTPEELIGKKMADDLRGLAPSLIEALASMGEIGSTVDDMTVTLQLVPYGDRANLLAHGYIKKERARWGDSGTDRWVATPDMVDLAEAAYKLQQHLTKKATGHAIIEFLDDRA